MSAFVVDKSHIDLMVRAALRAHPAGQPGSTRNLSWCHAETMDGDDYKAYFTPSQLGQILVDENVASVYHRYPDTDPDAGDLPGPCDAYYVGPEHEGWRKSEAFAFLASLRHAYCNRVADYEDAPWEFTEAKP